MNCPGFEKADIIDYLITLFYTTQTFRKVKTQLLSYTQPILLMLASSLSFSIMMHIPLNDLFDNSFHERVLPMLFAHFY